MTKSYCSLQQYESTLYSWANLKDFSEDFQGKLESFLLINLESVEVIMLIYTIPELMHIHFRDISSDGRYDSAKSCHIQFICKQIYIKMDNLAHDVRSLIQNKVYYRK
ncbi:hypothetical protein Tco_0648767 [Tanacetum coccineum]